MGAEAPGGMAARQLVAQLRLQPHPEGGFFAETLRDTSVHLPQSALPPSYLVGRAVSTAIYFLLPAGSVSRLHRMPAAEVWHFYLGEPLTVVELGEDGNVKQTVLGKDLAAGQQLQHVVPPGVWFGSHPTLEPVGTTSTRDPEAHFSLVGCTVAPAFAFDDFELADRAQLLAEYPGLADLVTHLT
eukprot:SM000041S15430  [mRNA]  locus=s41:15162:16016:- [translate_table: standard]